MVCVVSQPDRQRGRGRKTSPSPVSARALEAGLPLLRPEKVGAPECIEALGGHAPDVGVVVAFGQFIPKSVRELPARGFMINAHASLLPRHRGASPIAQSILDGDAETGISVMRVDREMDAGPVALARRTPIDPMENTAELTERLGQMAGEALVEALDRIAEDRVEWTPQDASQATLAPKLQKADGRIDWRRPATELVRHVHGMAPRPGAFGTLVDGEQAQTLRVLRARVADPAEAPGDDAAPGTLVRGEGPDAPALAIATGEGWLVPLEVQREGKRAMPIADFLRGHALGDGARFDATPAQETGTDR